MDNTRLKKDKYPATTPPRVTNEIREFAEELGGEPHYIPYRPLPFAKPSLCINNCEIARQLGLGTPVLGWCIWATRNLWLTAEYHCVLRNQDGYIDITPTQCSGQVLFVPDGQEINESNVDDLGEHLLSLPSERWGKSKLLIDHPLVSKALLAMEQASLASHRTGNTDSRTWNRQIDQMERLLDAYYAQNRQPSRKSLRAKKKIKRQRRKNSRRNR